MQTENEQLQQPKIINAGPDTLLVNFKFAGDDGKPNGDHMPEQVAMQLDEWQARARRRRCMSNPGRLIPFGYTIPDAETRLNDIMSDPGTLLLDIRSRPVSRYRPQWNKSRLKAQWGRRYAHSRNLGNINYKDRSLPIVLRAPEPSITTAARFLERGSTIVVVCACKDYDICHRKLVTELIEQRRASFPRCPECGDLLPPDFFGEPCVVEGRVVCETCMIVSDLFQRKRDV